MKADPSLRVETIRDYAALDNRQVEQIRTAIDEADHGDFAPHAEVQRVFKKWMQLSRKYCDSVFARLSTSILSFSTVTLGAMPRPARVLKDVLACQHVSRPGQNPEHGGT